MKLLLAVVAAVLLSAGAYALSVKPVQTQSTLKVEAVKTQQTLKVEPATGVNYNPQGSNPIIIQGN
jgi:hypothetical protein